MTKDGIYNIHKNGNKEEDNETEGKHKEVM